MLLDDDKRTEQESKANLFFLWARKELSKHFDHWCNDLLFLSVYSESPTAKVVVNFILSTPDGEWPSLDKE